jgi:allantoicase
VIELSARWLGGSVLAASDDSFGDKEKLLREAAPIATPGRYGPRGELVDGWETRRRRAGRAGPDGRPMPAGGGDWALVRLGVPGLVREIEVDTSFFAGNPPVDCRVEGIAASGYPDAADLLADVAGWTELASGPLKGDARNTFAVAAPASASLVTHVRLWIQPDGGVARLRVYGDPVVDPRQLAGGVELSSRRLGAAVLAASDTFYTSADALLRPDSPRTMGDGWETRRRRDDGHDWVVIALGVEGWLDRIELDTTHFVANASGEFALSACRRDIAPDPSDPGWSAVLGRTRLQPDTPHVFPVLGAVRATHVRLDAYPDGGMARLRVQGRVTDDGLARVRRRWNEFVPTPG